MHTVCFGLRRRASSVFCLAVASRQPQRTLYSAEELGLLYTQNNRNNTFKDKANGDPHQSNLYKDDILAKFDELSIREKSTELRNFIHLMNLDTDDTKKVHSLLTKYEQSYYGNTPHNISFVQFGADIMRLCHLLKQPDVALNFYRDVHLWSFFDQQETYKVLLDLLYKQKQYDRLYECYREIRERLLLYERMPTNTLNCLAFAACYHLNTPEHYQYAKDLWAAIDHHKQMNRSQYLLSALALKQNDPEFAIALLANQNETFGTVRFLRLTIYIHCKRFKEAFRMIRGCANFDRDSKPKRKPTIGKQMIDDLGAAVKAAGDAKQLEVYTRLSGILQRQGLISDETLEQKLCAEFPPMLPHFAFRKLKNKMQRGKALIDSE